MKIIKLCIDGVQVRIKQPNANVAMCYMDGYTGFMITGQYTMKKVVELARQRRYMAHLCVDCGTVVSQIERNGYHLCADCA